MNAENGRLLVDERLDRFECAQHRLGASVISVGSSAVVP